MMVLENPCRNSRGFLSAVFDCAIVANFLRIEFNAMKVVSIFLWEKIMIVNIIVGALIAIYAAFVIFGAIKKRRNAKKSGNAGCPFCSGGSCSGCEKKA